MVTNTLLRMRKYGTSSKVNHVHAPPTATVQKIMSVDVLDPGVHLPPQVCQALFKSRREPLVIKGQLDVWIESGVWDPSQICKHLGSKTTTFKIAPRRGTPAYRRHFRENEVVFETQCDFIQTTFHNFLEWLERTPDNTCSDVGPPLSEIMPPQCKRIKVDQSKNGESAASNNSETILSDSTLVSSTFDPPSLTQNANPLLNYPRTEYWIYADYKYMVELCHDLPEMLSKVDWSMIGFEGRDGKDSTLWIGLEGANTPCHFDTYGCNFVAQLHGKKKWTLFDSQDSDKLYPTRVPYEESSVFSRVNITDPDLTKYPLFSKAKTYEVSNSCTCILYQHIMDSHAMIIIRLHWSLVTCSMYPDTGGIMWRALGKILPLA